MSQKHAADQRGGDHAVVDDVRIDDVLAHRVGHVQMENEEGDEVEERRPQHGHAAATSTRVETTVATELAAS